jgi:ubiquinone/menaquinone biosynthesis C-methylase UbiE
LLLNQLSRPSIRCPACSRNRLSPADQKDGSVRCAGCGASYPVAGGVIDLLPGSAAKRTPGQALMEWPPVIRIYESRWWRKNPLFALYTGIPFEREYELVSAAADLARDATFLDLACGSGIYSRPLARRLKNGWVVGLDLSAPMLSYLSRAAGTRGLHNLTLIRGSALDLPFDGETFHGVNCCGALHLFPDVERALEEVHRVLRPGGGFTSAVLGKPSGPVPGRLAEFHFRKMGLRAFQPEEFRSLLHSAGFQNVTFLHRKDGWGWLVVSAVR